MLKNGSTVNVLQLCFNTHILPVCSILRRDLNIISGIISIHHSESSTHLALVNALLLLPLCLLCSKVHLSQHVHNACNDFCSQLSARGESRSPGCRQSQVVKFRLHPTVGVCLKDHAVSLDHPMLSGGEMFSCTDGFLSQFALFVKLVRQSDSSQIHCGKIRNSSKEVCVVGIFP